MKKCPNCGNKCDDNETFCFVCGCNIDNPDDEQISQGQTEVLKRPLFRKPKKQEAQQKAKKQEPQQHKPDFSWIEEETRQAHIIKQRNGLGTKGIVIIAVVAVLVVAGILALVFRKTYDEPVTVYGKSMEPTYSNGDQVKTTTVIKKNKIKYDTVICFKNPVESSASGDALYVRRVVGLPGDEITFEDGTLYANGVKNDRFTGMSGCPKGTFILGEDQYYCMGDNYTFSIDSRFFGPVSLENITNIVQDK